MWIILFCVLFLMLYYLLKLDGGKMKKKFYQIVLMCLPIFIIINISYAQALTSKDNAFANNNIDSNLTYQLTPAEEKYNTYPNLEYPPEGEQTTEGYPPSSEENCPTEDWTTSEMVGWSLFLTGSIIGVPPGLLTYGGTSALSLILQVTGGLVCFTETMSYTMIGTGGLYMIAGGAVMGYFMDENESLATIMGAIYMLHGGLTALGGLALLGWTIQDYEYDDCYPDQSTTDKVWPKEDIISWSLAGTGLPLFIGGEVMQIFSYLTMQDAYENPPYDKSLKQEAFGLFIAGDSLVGVGGIGLFVSALYRNSKSIGLISLFSGLAMAGAGVYWIITYEKHWASDMTQRRKDIRTLTLSNGIINIVFAGLNMISGIINLSMDEIESSTIQTHDELEQPYREGFVLTNLGVIPQSDGAMVTLGFMY